MTKEQALAANSDAVRERYKFSKRIDYLKDIKSTEAGYQLQPKGGFRTNILMHPTLNQFIYLTEDYINIIDIDEEYHYQMRLNVPLDQEKNYHLKQYPDTNRLLLGSFTIGHFEYHAH